jgi:hypothetical protein
MARSFNGTSDLIAADLAHLYAIASAFSVAAWVKGAAQNNKGVYGEGISTSSNPLFLIGSGQTTTSKARVSITTNSGGSALAVESTATAFDSNWHHLCFTQDASRNYVLYVDGVSDHSATYSSGTLSGINRAGIGLLRRNTNGNFFAGSIAEVCTLSRQLSAKEVLLLASGFSASHVAANHNWPLWGVDSPEPDIGTATMINGTLTGTSYSNGPPVSRPLIYIPGYLHTVAPASGIPYTETATVVSKTTLTDTETTQYVESQTISCKTTPSSTDAEQYTEISTITGRSTSIGSDSTQAVDSNTCNGTTTLTRVELASYIDGNTLAGVTTFSGTEGSTHEYTDSGSINGSTQPSSVDLFAALDSTTITGITSLESADISAFVDSNITLTNTTPDLSDHEVSFDDGAIIDTTTALLIEDFDKVDSATVPVRSTVYSSDFSSYIDLNTITSTTTLTSELVGVIVELSAEAIKHYHYDTDNHYEITANKKWAVI